ncbi:hypothetical protein [Streptomyces sp. NPDC059957]
MVLPDEVPTAVASGVTPAVVVVVVVVVARAATTEGADGAAG